MPKTSTDRVNKHRARKRDIGGKAGKRPPDDLGFKVPDESDPEAWLLAYLPRAFPLPFGQVHRDIMAAFVHALRTGGNCAIAAPRGTGKSTLLNGLALWALLTGRTKFPVILPWADKAKKQALRFWSQELCFNGRLDRDYHDVTAPFVACRGVAQRLASQTSGGEAHGARLGLAEGMIVLPHDYGAIGSSTINGNPRGMNYSDMRGAVHRPSLVIIDDPQDRKTARSPARVAETVERIDGDVAGMAGPDERMPMMMACTVIEKGDVADHYLDHGDWRAVRVGQIITWPAGWDERDSKTRTAWDEWNEIRLNGEAERDGGMAAVSHYAAHKAAMTDGLTVSWESRFDAKRGEPDALYSAMHDFYALGEGAFMAERQNDPIESSTRLYEVTAEMICAHAVDNMPPLHVPESATIIVAHCDINRSGLHWCIGAFGQDMTCHVPAYGRYPQRGELWEKNAPELERKQAIYAGLRELGERLGGLSMTQAGAPIKLGALLVDRGYEPDVVHKFAAAASYPFNVVPALGRAAHKYQVRRANLIGRPMEGCHVTKGDAGRFLVFNSDMWRETAQRAFLAEPGAPGGCTLYAGEGQRFHMPFAEQVAAEHLVNKYQTDYGPRWEWRHAVGSSWDWGDALTGCYVAAAMMGLSASGIPTDKPKRRKPRRVRHVPV